MCDRAAPRSTPTPGSSEPASRSTSAPTSSPRTSAWSPAPRQRSRGDPPLRWRPRRRGRPRRDGRGDRPPRIRARDVMADRPRRARWCLRRTTPRRCGRSATVPRSRHRHLPRPRRADRRRDGGPHRSAPTATSCATTPTRSWPCGRSSGGAPTRSPGSSATSRSSCGTADARSSWRRGIRWPSDRCTTCAMCGRGSTRSESPRSPWVSWPTAASSAKRTRRWWRCTSPGTSRAPPRRSSPASCASRPATRLARPDGTVLIQPTWTWDPAAAVPRRGTTARQDAELVAQLRDLITTTVAADVDAPDPIAAELSGGVDSSTVVGFASEALRAAGRPGLELVSLVMPGHRYDETPFIRDVAAAVGRPVLEHVPEPLGAAHFEDEIRRTLLPPAPPDVTMVEATTRVAVERGCRVLLAGHGGDEWLSGSRYRCPTTSGGSASTGSGRVRHDDRTLWPARTAVPPGARRPPPAPRPAVLAGAVHRPPARSVPERGRPRPPPAPAPASGRAQRCHGGGGRRSPERPDDLRARTGRRA